MGLLTDVELINLDERSKFDSPVESTVFFKVTKKLT